MCNGFPGAYPATIGHNIVPSPHALVMLKSVHLPSVNRVADFVARHPGRVIGVAGIDLWEEVGAEEVHRAVRDLGLRGVIAASALQRRGIGTGDRVAALGRNSVEYAALYYATAKIGAMLVPLNFWHRSGEHEYAIDDSEAAIKAHVRTQLAGYNTPREVIFVGQLPKNAVGKTQKHILRKEYGSMFGHEGGERGAPAGE